MRHNTFLKAYITQHISQSLYYVYDTVQLYNMYNTDHKYELDNRGKQESQKAPNETEKITSSILQNKIAAYIEKCVKIKTT